MDEYENVSVEEPSYHLSLDSDGYLLSVYYGVYPDSTDPIIDSLDGYDFSGVRLQAYQWTGSELIFDDARYRVLEIHEHFEERQKTIMELTAQLRSTDSVIIDSLEKLFSATTLTGFLQTLIQCSRDIRDTLTSRNTIREQIDALRKEIGG